MNAPLTPEAAVDFIEKVGATQSGYRRAHARGLVLRGVFQAGSEAKSLSKAEHFQGAAIPCLVRLSNASANPCAPDRTDAKSGRVLGLGIRFDLPSGAKTTWRASTSRSFRRALPRNSCASPARRPPGPR